MVSPLPPLAPLPPLPPALRRAGVVAAGLVAAGGLVWAARDAWPWRGPLTAAPIVITAAYAEFVDTLGDRKSVV